MSNHKDNGTLYFLGGCVIVAFLGIFAAGIHAGMHKHQYEAECQERYNNELTNNLAHPQILGTNEVGETIKRYVIPMDGMGWNYQYVYEVGDTKTVNTPKNKGRLDVEATVTH